MRKTGFLTILFLIPAFSVTPAFSQPSALSSRPSKYWAFQPLKRVPLPKVKNAAWCRTPIDRFLLAKLEQKGLKPNPPADRRTLIRRVTFDLIGLPPTPEEVEAFVKDKSPNAYEKVVDRLLVSPRYGERWGRHWLDIAHYGDTHGYDKDKRRDHAWPYRDYVIRAFNSDKPYAQFVQEQIAGDVLGERGSWVIRSVGNWGGGTLGNRESAATGNRMHRPKDQVQHSDASIPQLPNYPITQLPSSAEGVIATGFLVAGPWDFVGQVELAEGTVEKAKTRSLDRDDIVANVLSTFNSLTVHCARCHDHKFDPIPQKDYYRLQAVFAGIERGDRPYFEGKDGAQYVALEQQRKAIATRRDTLLHKIAALTDPELARLDAEIAGLKSRLAALPDLAGGAESPSNGYHSGIEPRPDVEKWVQIDLGQSVPIDEIRLIPARPTDFPDTPGFGFPARFRVAVSDDPAFGTATVVSDLTAADFPNPGDSPVGIGVGGRSARYVRMTATRLWLRTNDYVFALAEMQVFSNKQNRARGANVTALDSIEAGRWSTRHLVDDFDSRHRLPDFADSKTLELLRKRSLLSARLQQAEGERRLKHDALMDAAMKTALEQATSELADVEKRLKALPPPPMTYAAVPHAPRPIHVLARGDVEKPLMEAQPGALSCLTGREVVFSLSDPQDEGSRRAALANWITSPQNPLTWRSIVNRVWRYHFGRGLVDTPSDFGLNGSRPSHPELLDWLALHFVEGGNWVVRSSGNGEKRSQPAASPQPLNHPIQGKGKSPITQSPNHPTTQLPDPYTCGGSMKKLHRLIVLSAAYRQSSRGNPAFAKVDADNSLLWRMNRQRLEAEEIRDTVLAVSGSLDLKMGGPGFELFRFKDDHSPVYDYSALEKINDPAAWRRAIYAFTVRSVQNPFLECLDCADPNINTPVRNTTLTALQALALLNNPFMVQQAERFAARLRGVSGDVGRQIDAAVSLAFGRPPTPQERADLMTYAQKYGLTNVCRTLFNANEFVFVD